MKHRSFIVRTVVAAVVAGSTFLNAESKPVTDSGPSRTQIAQAATGTKAVVEANTALGMDLIHKLSADAPNQNLFISPLSIGTCFAMAFAGSHGTTQEAMQKVLHYSSTGISAVSKGYSDLLAAFADVNSKVQVEIANAIFCRKDVKLDDHFLSEAKSDFKSEVTSMDFAAPDAASRVNSWVSNKTHGKISTIVDRIEPSLMSILINAAYFKGQWAHTFAKEATAQADFHLAGGKTKKVSMMHGGGHRDYYETPKFQAVVLPYQEYRYSACIFLPSRTSSLEELQKTLSAATWNSWMSKFASKKGSVALPRFKVEYSASLSSVLQSLGMGVAFDSHKADFSGMHKGDPNFFIGDVKHKTYLKVDEFGTEAAAVTAIEMAGAAFIPNEVPFEMTVDRPFLFAIKDNQTGSLMFIGAIYDPGQI